jgi:hypothetical protein
MAPGTPKNAGHSASAGPGLPRAKDDAAMSRLAKIMLVLATAALSIAAEKTVPMVSPQSEPVAADVSIVPDDVTQTIGPLPQAVPENYI